MKIIAVDIGNSQVKLAWIDLKSGKIEKKVEFLTKKKVAKEKYSQEIQEIIKKKILEKPIINSENIKEIFLISVVPEINEVIKNSLEKIIKSKTIIFEPKMLNLNNNKECGHDNIMLALAALKRTSSYLLVSFGTANVFITFIKAKIKSIVISPGLELSKNSLVEKTSLIQDFKNYEYDGIFNLGSTNKSVSAGVILGQISLVEKIINDTQKTLGKDIPVFFTGYNFLHIKDQIQLNCSYEYLPNLIFEGMFLAYQIARGKKWNKWKITFDLLWKKYVN